MIKFIKKFGFTCLLFLSLSFLGQNSSNSQSPPTYTDVDEECLNAFRNIQAILQNPQSKIDEATSVLAHVRENDLYQTIIDGRSLETPFGVLPYTGDDSYSLVVNDLELTSF